ncbi:MAG: tetratricopeptide repeat protein [Bryobacteraceae bacterium]
MQSRIVLLSCAGLVMSAALFAQPPTGSRGTPTGVSPTTPTNPTNPNSRSPTSLPNPNQQQQQMDTMQRPVYVSGKVMLDDGTPPPESLMMQLVCNGTPRSVGYTDSKGRFSIDLGNRNNSAVFADASEAGGYGPGGGFGGTNTIGQRQGGAFGGLSERSLMGCDLQAALPGFRSDAINLGSRHSLDNPEVGTIVLHRTANVEGLTISATSALAPKDARKAFDKGWNEIKKSKWENAEKELTKAVDTYPKYAAAWYQLGFVQQEQNNLEAARKSYAQSLAADSKFVSPYLQLAVLAARENNWKEVASDTDKLLRLNPVDFPQAWLYNSLANYHLQNWEASEKSARQGLELDKGHRLPKLDHLLGVLLAQKRDYAGAAEHMRNYLAVNPTGPDADLVRKQLAEVRKVTAAQAGTKAPGASEPPKQ